MYYDYPWLRTLVLALMFGLSAVATGARAASDEIVVFTDDFEKKGEFGDDFALGVEHYSSFGRVSNPTFGSLSQQTSFLIAEFKTKKHFDSDLGIGHGWTAAGNKRTFEAMIGLPL